MIIALLAFGVLGPRRQTFWRAARTQYTNFLDIALGRLQSNKYNKAPIFGNLCPGCQLASEGDIRCGEELRDAVRYYATALNRTEDDPDVIRHAGKNVSTKHYILCSRCDPDACSQDQKLFLRFDFATPRIVRAYTLPFLPSVPKQLRLPLDAVRDPIAYFSNDTNLMNNRIYLFDYNPSLVRLQTHQSPLYLNETAAYLASVRVSSHNSAFAGELSAIARSPSMPVKEYHNYLGLALLREDFSIIDSAVFGAPLYFNGDRADFRLYNFNGQIYFTLYDEIARLSLANLSLQPDSFRVMRDAFNSTHPFMVKFDNKVKACCSDFCQGKNFNYFSGNNSDEIWVETSPVEPHAVERVLFGKCPPNSSQVFTDDASMGFRQSFGSVEEVYLPKHGYFQYPPYTPHRGTACCLEMQHPRTQSPLLVGISHRKTWRPRHDLNLTSRQYTLNFYAFEARPPYTIVSMSGSFCFGHSEHGSESKENYLVNLTRMASVVMGETMACPFIQFPMSIIDSALPGLVVVSYGINDAISRIIEIPKAEIARMLFNPLETTTYE